MIDNGVTTSQVNDGQICCLVPRMCISLHLIVTYVCLFITDKIPKGLEVLT